MNDVKTRVNANDYACFMNINALRDWLGEGVHYHPIFCGWLREINSKGKGENAGVSPLRNGR
jgi:hypothetical protein